MRRPHWFYQVPRLLAAPTLLLVVLLAAVALAACGAEEPTPRLERTRADASPPATDEPEPTPTPEPPCPERPPSASALLSPSETSVSTGREALVALFEATGGDSWDSSGTWAGRAPMGEGRA